MIKLMSCCAFHLRSLPKMNTLSNYVSWDGLANTTAIQKLISDFEKLQEENGYMEVVNTELRARLKQAEEEIDRLRISDAWKNTQICKMMLKHKKAFWSEE